MAQETLSNLMDRLARSTTFELREIGSDGQWLRYGGDAFCTKVHRYAQAIGPHASLYGQRVVVLMRSSVDCIALLLAIWQKGAMPVLMRSTHPRATVLELAQRYGVSHLAMDASLARGLTLMAASDGIALPGGLCIVRVGDGMQPTVRRGQAALGLPTSGSTGSPKVVFNTFDRLWMNAQMHVASVGVTAQDRVLLSLPLAFSYGFVAGLLGCMAAEACAMVNGGYMNAGMDATVMMATPAGCYELLAMLTRMAPRVLTVGGDVLHRPLAEELLARMPETALVATYGLTEAGPRVASSHVTREVLATFGGVPLGSALSGVSWALQGAADIDGSVGELMVRSPTLMQGYLDDEAATAEVLKDDGRVLMTGDVFAMKAGAPVFYGRRKRLIVRGGEKIFPAMVESRILSLCGVRDAWVTSQAHATYGEVPVAYVVPHESFNADGAMKRLRSVLPASHIPVAWSVVDALPTNARK